MAADNDTASPGSDTGEVVIGDIAFVPITASDMTFEHRLYAASQIRSSGLRSAEVYQQIEDPDTLGMAILSDVYQSDHAFTLLAAVFRRKGEPWQREQAPINAQHFKLATGEAADQLTRALGGAILALFTIGAGSSRTSPTSSSPPPAATVTGRSSAPQAATSTSGTASSGHSQAATQTDTAPSRAGLSAKGSPRTATGSGGKRGRHTTPK